MLFSDYRQENLVFSLCEGRRDRFTCIHGDDTLTSPRAGPAPAVEFRAGVGYGGQGHDRAIIIGSLVRIRTHRAAAISGCGDR